MQAALEYLRTQEDLENAEVAGKLLKHRSQDIVEAATLTLARTYPLSKAFSEAVDSLKKSKSDRDGAAMIRLAIEVSRSRSRQHIFDEDPERAKRQQLAEAMFESAIEMGAFFRLSEFGMRREQSSGLGLYASFGDRRTRFYNIPSALLLGSGKSVVSGLFKAKSTDVGKMLALVKVFCLDFEGQCGGAVHVLLTRGGVIITKSGLRLDKEVAPGGVRLRVDGGEQSNDVHVSWTDRSGVAQNATLGALEDGNGMTFSIVSSRKLREAQDDG
jgi:hypothetical protein